MLLIQCTKKLAEELKGHEISKEPVENDALYSWHVNLFGFQRRTYALIMNDKTRYNVVFGPLGKKKFEQFDELVKKEIKKTLTSDEFSQDIIERYMEACSPVRFGPTCQRSITAQINDQILIAKVRMEEMFREEEELDRVELNQELNRVPMLKLPESRPVNEMEKELLGDN